MAQNWGGAPPPPPPPISQPLLDNAYSFPKDADLLVLHIYISSVESHPRYQSNPYHLAALPYTHRDANLICNKRVRWTPKKIENMVKRLRRTLKKIEKMSQKIETN